MPKPTTSDFEQRIASLVDPEAAVALMKAYAWKERWDHVERVVETQLARAADHDDRFALVAGYAELLEVYSGDKEDAYVWWLRAYVDDPGRAELIGNLQRLAEATGQWRPLIDVGEQALEEPNLLDDAAKIAVLRLSAEVSLDRLGDRELARSALERLLLLDSGHAWARSQLDALTRGR